MKEKRVREEFVLPLNRINNVRQHHSCENEALSIERAKQNPKSRKGTYRPPVGILHINLGSVGHDRHIVNAALNWNRCESR